MSDTELILVTGASGFIAQHVILALLERGYAVRGTVRDLKHAQDVLNVLETQSPVARSRVTIVAADLEQDAGWEEAMLGISAVMHVASPIPLEQPDDPDILVAPARDGALRVLRAAKAGGITKVVMTSSVVAVAEGHGKDRGHGRTFTEADWTDPDGPHVNPYARSKAIAERAAWDYVNGEGCGMALTTILPGLVLGPVLSADFGVSPELIRRMLAGGLPGSPPIGFSLVDVRDVAALEVAALESEAANGERFICTNDFVWMADLAKTLRDACPTHRSKIPHRSVPGVILRVMGIFDRAARSLIPDLGRRVDFHHDKAERILGWEPRSGREAAIATAHSMIKLKIV
jgi:dihydroflavonol-4-reductase